ncbi:nucleotide synthetase [Sphingomonas elodea]|uniref:nucleotide synthetase n=1 Tax=Sphingomonas elodea TaxID=179878 RepID=UPI0002630D88|nr:nucleotide synthetase [Sphingomonas elodea]
MQSLQFHIIGYEEVDRIGNGKPVTVDDDFTKIVRDFVMAPANVDGPAPTPDNPKPGVVPTQLDFVVRQPCCVILKLIGDYWEYTPNSLYVSTKHEYPDGKYRRAFPVLDNKGRIAAVGFFVEYVTPPQDRRTCDGLNLYVDFVHDTYRLPLIIDPDVENRGDGG